MQTIKYKGTEFQIRENTLLIKESAVPLLVKYRKLQLEYLDDFDTSLIDEYEDKIKTFETAIEQVKNNLELNQYNSEDKRKEDELYLESTEQKLEAKRVEFMNDKQVKIIQKAKQEIIGLAIMQLCYDKELIKRLLNKLLIGDLSIIDYESEDYLPFALGAVTYFFTISGLSKNELNM